MTTSRRYFLRSGVMASLFAGLCFNTQMFALGQQRGQQSTQSTALTPIPDTAKMDNVFYYTKATFDPYLNTAFRARTGRVTTTLTLLEIADCAPGAPVSSGRISRRSVVNSDCFILIFKADRTLPKGVTIVELEHSALGKFDLFLGNWKKWSDQRGIYYQAVINHTQPL